LRTSILFSVAGFHFLLSLLECRLLTDFAIVVDIVVIVVCSLLGVATIVVVLAVIVKYRRYRQRYGQHELLINNEGTDNDLDGDSPMLDG
jgi:hypothetical protein